MNTSNTQSTEGAHVLHPSRSGLVRVLREALADKLAAYERDAAAQDEALEYRRGVADAAALVEDVLGRQEVIVGRLDTGDAA